MYQNIKNVDIKNKRVLLRVDLNVPMLGSQILDNTRISNLLPTIQYLKSQEAKIILVSHFGRPNGVSNAEMSLKILLPELKRVFGSDIIFSPECIGDSVIISSHNLKSNEILLLENIRFYPGEESNDIALARNLAKLADIYVNDAFSCSHRAHASIVKICDFLPSYAGLLLINELMNLENAMSMNLKPTIAIIGGKKISSKLNILANLSTKVDYLVITGAMANTFLKAQGNNIGESFYEPDLIQQAQEILNKLGNRIILPVDAGCISSLNSRQDNCHIMPVSEIKNCHTVLDIGPKSCIKICKILDESKTVLWNGPLGLFEEQRFAVSTMFLARYIAYLTESHQILSIAGGGDTVAALAASGVSQSFTYVSTAGGAFLEWLEGKVLPGIIPLMR